MTTTYTVLSRDGEVIERGLSGVDAAREILTSDGRQFDIRHADGLWTLWSCQEVANRRWTQTALSSARPSLKQAEDDIFEQTLSASWLGHYEAVTDKQYDEMLAGLEKDI